jgi:2'-5' RNA ligase
MGKRIYNQQALFGPLYAYLVVLSPPQKILNDIAAFKKEMNALADIGEQNLHSKAHITLTDKLTDDADFPETIARLLKGQKPFEVNIFGHGFFDHRPRKTVFINVKNHEPILELMRHLKIKSGFPHLALAKKLTPEVFDLLRPWLMDFDYNAQWKCTEVLVLRKLMSEKHLGFKETFKIALD